MTPEAEQLYAAALTRRPQGLVARDRAGVAVELATARWLAGAGSTDLRVLRRARGPVLDIGCGPGRHVRALADRGVAALGIDASPAAVRVARDRGTRVLQGSVFDAVPAMGGWRTALKVLSGEADIFLRKDTFATGTSAGSVACSMLDSGMHRDCRARKRDRTNTDAATVAAARAALPR